MSIKNANNSPMGWNSFDCYGCTIYEEDVKANIDYMAENLLQYGYEYIVIDNGWFAEYELPDGQKYPAISLAEKSAVNITIDQNGRVDSSKLFFPTSIKTMADYAHSKGLKFGIHLMRGIPRKAVDNCFVIEGTNYTADQIADKNSTCVWCDFNYGVDMSKPGAQEYYDSLMRKFAQWKLDFIKYDDITAFPLEIEAVVKAIEKTNYPMMLSLSPGGDSDTVHINMYKKATTLRVTADIWDNDESLDNAFAGLEKYYTFADKNFFIDLDMLCVGHLRLNVPKDIKDVLKNNNMALSGEGEERLTRLTKQQQRSFMTIRSISSSPLLIGSDLPTMDNFTYNLLTNKDMIYCNQKTTKCIPIDIKGFSIWKSDANFIAIFNRSKEVKKIDLSILKAFIDGEMVKDIWNNKKIDMDDIIEIEPQDVLFIRTLS